MSATFVVVLTFIASLGSGIMAGIFFIFSSTIMTALARLPAGRGAAAMNSINRVILNPLFLSLFMGTALLCVVLSGQAIIGWRQSGAAWLLAGSLFYLVGIVLVTMVFNVPLNNALAAVGPETAEGATLWRRYLAEWVPWNHVRSVSGIVSLACFIMALR